MRSLARSACVAVLPLLLVVPASPAVAKGPTDVTVSGPRVDGALSWTERAGDVDVGSLSEAARIPHHWDGSGLIPSPRLSADQLGPRYVLTWTAGAAPWAVQHAYPFAQGGAWVRFLSLPAGDTGGGWVRAPALTEQLVALRQRWEPSPSPVVATTDETAASDGPRAGDPAGRSPYAVGVPVGLALVVVLGAGVLLGRRRLLSR